jgi:predicted outer membrane repeat protein
MRLSPLSVLAGLLALAICPSSFAAIFTVGAVGTGCTHTSVQAAVNSAATTPGADTIRIARSATYTAQEITINSSEELYLIGGYATCASTTTNSPQTELSGAGGNQAPVLTITTSSVTYLQNLRITGGDNTSTSGFGLGGGIFFTGSGALDIRDSTIDQNSANQGGGIYALGNAVTSDVLIADNVLVGFNTARFNGGGIVAAGLEFTVTGSNTTLLSNQALGVGGVGGFGGGALVTSTDDFRSFLYLSPGGIGGSNGVSGNSAVNGGAVAIIGETDSGRNAEVQVYSTVVDRPVVISGNTATQRGGAFYR